MPLEAIPGLNGFVLFFALPCMLYRFCSTTPLAQLLDGGVFAVWGVCGLVLVPVVVAFSRNLHGARRVGPRMGWNDAAFGALVAAFPNTGFIGVPLVVALLGAQGAGPVIITLIFDLVVTSSLCIALSRLGGADQHGAAKAARHALRGVLVNPLPWAIGLGGLASALHWQPPVPLWRTLTMLADAASPVALFTIGVVLARSAMLTRGAAGVAGGFQVGIAMTAVGGVLVPARAAVRPRALAPVDYLPVVVIKLALHPLLVWLVGLGLIKAGLPLSPTALTALVLVAALPSASNVAMLAERSGADSGRIARIILLTTAASFFSFPLVAAWLH